MKREDFVKVIEETLDSLSEESRIRIRNVAILVEDFSANQRSPKRGNAGVIFSAYIGNRNSGSGKIFIGAGLYAVPSFGKYEITRQVHGRSQCNRAQKKPRPI